MPYPICHHIRTTGLQCQAPSFREGIYCFFHNRLHQRRNALRRGTVSTGVVPPSQPLHLDPLDDRESVQLSLSVVIHALAAGQLETRRATALLYGLQLASANPAGLHSQPASPNGPNPAALEAPAPPTSFEHLDEKDENERQQGEEDDSKGAEAAHPSRATRHLHPLPSVSDTESSA